MRRAALKLAFLAIAQPVLSERQSCVYAVDPLTIIMPGAGGTSQVSVTAAAGCGWSASSDRSWLSVQTTSGSGSGTVIFSAAANSLSSQRIGFLTVAGRSIFVTQLQPAPPAPPSPVTPPGAPTQLAAAVSGHDVTLTWSAPITGGAPTTYVLAAGTAPGWTNLGSFATGSTQRSFSASNVANGVYFARVSAQNTMGISPASNEVSFTIPQACTDIPLAPPALQSSVSGRMVTLNWVAPSNGDLPTGYSVEAGSEAGRADLAIVNTESTATTFTATAPPGTYFVRVRALTACGASAPSQEVVVVVR
jgi:hypothetical protein